MGIHDLVLLTCAAFPNKLSHLLQNTLNLAPKRSTLISLLKRRKLVHLNKQIQGALV